MTTQERGSAAMDRVHRAESLERTVLEELHDAADASLRERLGLERIKDDGVLVSVARHEPHILLNRALGLGSSVPLEQDRVKRVRRLYDQAGVDRYFIQARLEPGVHPPAWLDDLGLEARRRWMKFERSTESPPALNPGIETIRIEPDRADTFGALVADGFGFSPAVAPLLARLVERPGWRLYLSYAGDQPMGGAALYVRDGLGWCDWAATHPDHRGRGSQSALLARRIADARELGCHTLIATTGEAVPGDPQHSYRNLIKAGFRETYVRENFAPQSG